MQVSVKCGGGNLFQILNGDSDNGVSPHTQKYTQISQNIETADKCNEYNWSSCYNVLIYWEPRVLAFMRMLLWHVKQHSVVSAPLPGQDDVHHEHRKLVAWLQKLHRSQSNWVSTKGARTDPVCGNLTPQFTGPPGSTTRGYIAHAPRTQGWLQWHGSSMYV